eukprot:TRINITY_DN13599_c0_g2_i1.p1 TRINITY_DN13599_c0_g2~~TRINITY_DN13599_c0_g2_i1.p1  ORF type:complete len:936 (+),score=184.53 TRINITY_DN13599_c0_g2_i1:67-2874(+)
MAHRNSAAPLRDFSDAVARAATVGLRTPLLNTGQSAGVVAPSASEAVRHADGSAWQLTRKYKPCTKRNFYGQHVLTGFGLFGRIEEAATDNEMAALATLRCLDMQSVVGQDEIWLATYEAYMNVTTIHAMHFAASIGSISAMQWIVETSCGSQSGGQQQSAVIDVLATLVFKDGRRSTHYTPLMSALWMSQTSAAIWLLDQGASATIANNDGLTPLHMLAWTGLQRAADREQALERVSTKLIEKSADLSARSSALEHRTDEAAEKIRSKTALELAAVSKSTYPKAMLHLLTNTFQMPTQSQLLAEVQTIAQANPCAAEGFLRRIREEDRGADVRSRLKTEVAEMRQQGRHIEEFVRIFALSPTTGSEILKLLMMEPEVTSHQKYPLPMYTVLPNKQILCTYQPAAKWDGSKEPPAWHRPFRRGDDLSSLSSVSLLQTNVYEVRMKILHMPGVLHMKVLAILSILQPAWHHMQVFAQIPVYGMVECTWSHCQGLYFYTMFWELLVLAVLLVRGLYPVDNLADPLRILLLSIINGYILNSVCNLIFGVVTYSRATGLPQRGFLVLFAKKEVISLFCLLLIVNFEGADSGYEKVMVSFNVIVRCFLIFAMMRVLPVIGPLIIAVVSSFFPMLGMFTFMGMVFAMFAAAFIMFRDENRSAGFVLLYLYQALFLTDRDAAESISALDVAKEQTLDIGTEIYTGSDDPWLQQASACVSLIATSIFSLVLMNLTIGMYTKYYEEMEPLAEMILRHQRVKTCVGFMLSPAWWLHSNVIAPFSQADGGQGKPSAEQLACSAVFVSTVLYVLFVFGLESPVSATLTLALLKQAFQGMFVAKIARLFSDENENYLWISHRADYDPGIWDTQHSTADLRREMIDFRSDYQKTVHSLEDRLEQLAQNVQETNRNVHEISKNMNRLLSIYGVEASRSRLKSGELLPKRR